MKTFQDALNEFVSLPKMTDENLAAQEVLKKNLEKIEDHKTLMWVYQSEHSVISQMKDYRLLSLWDDLLKL